MVENPHLRAPPDAVQVDPNALRQLPASAQRVFKIILENGPISHSSIHDMTGIPPRTIRFALQRLRQAEMVAERVSLSDCRTCLFFVHPRLVDPEYIAEVRRTRKRVHDLQITVHSDLR